MFVEICHHMSWAHVRLPRSFVNMYILLYGIFYSSVGKRKKKNKHRRVTLLTNRSSKKTEGKPVVCHSPDPTSCRELTWLGEVPTFLSQFLLPAPTAYLALAAPAVRTLVGLLGYRIEMAQTKFKPTLKTCERGAGITQQGFTLLQQKSRQNKLAVSSPCIPVPTGWCSFPQPF